MALKDLQNICQEQNSSSSIKWWLLNWHQKKGGKATKSWCMIFKAVHRLSHTFNWHQNNFPSLYPSISSQCQPFLIRVCISRVGAILRLRKRKFFTPLTQRVTKYNHTTYCTKLVFPEPVKAPYFLYALKTCIHMYIYIYMYSICIL